MSAMPSPHRSARDYYDDFATSLLSDYCFGSRRVEMAIQFALTSIPKRTTCILDIGCGIGWSSQELARHFPASKVYALDLSAVLIQHARKLASGLNIEFLVQDLLDWNPKQQTLVDAIVLLDVYEHIPKDARLRVHKRFSELLSESGKIILTCPSKSYQDFLREKFPEKLQPVDEDVVEEDARRLAKDIGGCVEKFEPQCIWSEGDYNHILIVRNSRSCGSIISQTNLCTEAERRKLVRTELGLNPIRPGSIGASLKDPKVVFAVTSEQEFSFGNRLNRLLQLPFQISMLSGNDFGTTDEREWLFKRNAGTRLIHKLRGRICGWNYDAFQVESRAKWFVQQGIRCLVGFDTGAIEMLSETCRRARIPFVAYIRNGLDLQSRQLLKRLSVSYGITRNITAVVCETEAVLKKLKAIGVPSDRIAIIPPAVDSSLAGYCNVDAQPPTFVHVSDFGESNSQTHLIILAFGSVVKEVPDARLNIYGDGPLLEACRSLSKALGLASVITFEQKTRTGVNRAMVGSARCYVQHSVANGDDCGLAFPTSVVEAQIAGLPVIVAPHESRCGSVVDEETGFVVNEFDTKGIGKRMIEIATDSSLAARLGLSGSRIMTERFSEQTLLHRFSKVISNAVRGLGIGADSR